MVPEVTIHRRRFSFDGVSVEAGSNDATHLAWLEEFLTPSFDVAPAGAPADWSIRLEVDPAAYRSLLARGPAQGWVDGFAMDGGVTRLPRWRSGKGECVAHDAERSAFFLAGREPAVRIVADARRAGARVALLRAVREAALSVALSGPRMLLHAAAFCVDGGGFVLAGPKQAGKTTLLLQALRGGASFLANDRVCINLGTTPVASAGRPHDRSGTPRHPRCARSSGREDRALSAASPSDPGRVADTPPNARPRPSLTPPQLCDLMGAPSARDAQLEAVLFPHIVRDASALSLVPLCPAAFQTRLRANCATPPSRSAGALFRATGATRGTGAVSTRSAEAWRRRSAGTSAGWPRPAPPEPRELLAALSGAAAT